MNLLKQKKIIFCILTLSMITFSSCGHQSTDGVKKEFIKQHPIADEEITLYDGSPPILTGYG
jgi:hypothetical protein